MRRSRMTRSVKKEHLCDICGDIGFAHALSTCCICHISHEHIYCMKRNLHEVPEEWSCEACSSRNMDPPREDQLCQNKMAMCTKSYSPKVPESTNAGNAGNALRSPRNSPFYPPKNYIKVVETGKVKFLPAEDVVALTSGTSRVNASTVRGGFLNSPAGSLRAPHYPISKRTPISIAEVSKRLSEKESVYRSSRPQTTLMVGSVKQRTSPRLVVKGSTQNISAKEKANDAKELDKHAGKVLETPNEEYILEKPLDRAQVEPNASSLLLEAEPNVLSKTKELPNHHAINPTWKGTFDILGRFSPGVYYVRAHPPRKVSRKAYELSKKMPIILEFKVHPRGDVWPEIFHIDRPTGDDIALYFLPEDFRSSEEKYYCLLECIEKEDLAMSTCLNGVELMIFTSRELPMDSQRLNMKFFLWGVFRSSKKKQLPSQSFMEETNQEVDMEIDMVGGEDIGRVDYVMKKTFLKGNKVQFTMQTPKLKYPISTALDFQKLNSFKNVDGVAGSWNGEAGSSLSVVSNVHSDHPMNGNISPTSKIKKEKSTNFSAPPGFSRKVTSDVVAHKSLMEKTPVRVPTVVRNMERPPGFSKFLKPKDDPSEAEDEKQKAAAIAQSSSKNMDTSFTYPAKRLFEEFKESSLLSQEFRKDRGSPELPFISQQVVTRVLPKLSMVPDPTPSAKKAKFHNENTHFKTDTIKCQLEHCVKKEPMEEPDSPRMLSLSTVYMKEDHRRNTGK